jgi:16S rRNA (uracil1498-N3)-methyltransferase
MRAAWIPELLPQDSYILTGDIFHHLVNVTRLTHGDELLLLNGKGLSIKTKVDKIMKKELHLSHLEMDQKQRTEKLDIVLGVPKKEALELCLKQATEIGVNRVFLIKGDYSQIKIPEFERIQKLLVSALEQSNSAFLPEVIESSWQDLPWQNYQNKILLDSQTRDSKDRSNAKSIPVLLLIGPEGGFSAQELTYLHEIQGLEVLRLPTPILRTPTALAVGAGMVLERLMD